MFLTIGRTIKQSWINFLRNGWLSIAAVSVLILSLYTIGVLSVMAITTNNILKGIENKIDISVYFKSDIPETKILQVKKDLENYEEIKSVNYISKDQALENFKKNNANEPVIMQSLKEIGDNPLLASLVIKANNSSQYQSIADYINEAPFKDDVSRVNYEKNKDIINNLTNVIHRIKKIGLFISLIFGAISILIIFNTVRVTIYTHRQEIEVMRLVGASNTFIRLPYIFEGIFYGVLASLLSMGLLFATIKSISQWGNMAVLSQNLFNVLGNNFWLLLGIQASIGIFLGMISSWIAMRKYLKI